jgi:hypothetical protein
VRIGKGQVCGGERVGFRDFRIEGWREGIGTLDMCDEGVWIVGRVILTFNGRRNGRRNGVRYRFLSGCVFHPLFVGLRGVFKDAYICVSRSFRAAYLGRRKKKYYNSERGDFFGFKDGE